MVRIAVLNQLHDANWFGTFSEPIRHRSQCDLCRFFDWISIDPGADRREAYRFHVSLGRKLQAGPIAGGEQRSLLVFAIPISRTHGMEHESGGKLARSGHHGTSRGASLDLRPYLVQLTHDLRAPSAMNRPVDTTTARKLRIRGIHDRIHCDPGDVASYELYLSQPELNHKVGRHVSTYSEAPIACRK
jgi:hypothetical protein